LELPGDNVIPFRPRIVGEQPSPTFLELARDWMRTEGARLVRPEDAEKHIEHLSSLWQLDEKRLRPAVAKAAIYALLAPEGELGPSTVNKVLGTARRVIREAQINEKWAGRNPFELIRRLRQVKPVKRALSLAEARAMLPYLSQLRRREALCMLYLGLRTGELKALQISDVDTVTRTITIHRSNGRDSTKTGKIRVVPVPDAFWPHLEQAMDEVPPGGSLLFPNSSGGMMRSDEKLSRVLRTALGRAGMVYGYRRSCRRKGCGYRDERRIIERGRCPKCDFELWLSAIPKKVSWYDLRHSAATLHREAGADPLAIQLALGHAPENLTDSVYTHLTVDYVRRELNKLVI
jgi:integrase